MSGIMMHYMSHSASSISLVYDLDAANFLDVPTTGDTDATGNFPLTVSNTNSRISWSSDNGGVFRSTYIGDSMGDYIKGGPNFENYPSNNQSYTVFIAYKLYTSATGRLINSNETNYDWLMGAYCGHPQTFFSNGVYANLNSSTADTVWHLDWGTFDKTTGSAYLYSATTAAPTTHTYSLTGTQGSPTSFKGFNQIRLFNRSSGFEAAPADIGFVKVWNGVLSLSQIQDQWNTYYTRFGY